MFKSIQGTFHANKCKEKQPFIIIIENFSTFIGILQIFETKYVTEITESAMKFEQKTKMNQYTISVVSNGIIKYKVTVKF